MWLKYKYILYKLGCAIGNYPESCYLVINKVAIALRKQLYKMEV